jgi:glyoxylase-like metal-dependent hydrolase (beta-lactamase superfamily II)/8-oxo-dGTP pyrophosphatase MutT (NUDIX family)
MSEVPDGVEMGSVSRKIRPSATMMITRDGSNGVEVLLGRRAESMPAFPGYWAFPGGGLSRVDKLAVEELTQLDGPNAAAIAAIMREVVEELGFACADGKIVVVGEDARNLVVADKANWLPQVKQGKIPCDTSGIRHISSRTTPPFGPVLFENTFLHIHGGSSQEVPQPSIVGQTEFVEFTWQSAEQLLAKWKTHEMKIAPPVVTLLMQLKRTLTQFDGNMELSAEEMEKQQIGRRSILFAYGVEVVPVKTATLPPADHTNSYLIGDPEGDFVLVDPAARMREGMETLAIAVERHNGNLIAIVFTHPHSDHLGDFDLLREAFDVPMWGSQQTSEQIPCQRILHDGETLQLGNQKWQVLQTPGHHPGHICLLGDAGLVAGDMVAGIGTILIPPSEGDMDKYLHQLQRLIDLEPHLIFPSHGPVIPLPEKKLKYYLNHRSARHQRVLDAVAAGNSKLAQISRIAYQDSPDAHPLLAQDQTLSHLLSHQRSGKVVVENNNWKII